MPESTERTIMCANEVNYQKYGMSTAQWNALPANLKELCKKNEKAVHSIMKQMEIGVTPEELSAKLSSNKTQSGDSTKGTTVEKTTTSSLDDLKPKYNIEDLDNKAVKDVALDQWEDYFMARYSQNPDEARRDIVQILYRKEVAQVKGGLQRMLDNTKENRVVKTKYLAEGFATEQEKEAYEAKKKELYEKYTKGHAEFQKQTAEKINTLVEAGQTPESKALQAELDKKQEAYEAKMKELEASEAKDKLLQMRTAKEAFAKEKAQAQAEIFKALDPQKQKEIKELQAKMHKNSNPEAITAYNSFFREHLKNDPIDEGGHITPQQLDRLIQVEALDAIKIDGDRLDDMAIKAIMEKRFNEGIAKANELNDEIQRIKREEVSPKAKEIMNEAIKKDQELNRQYTQLLADAETDESRQLRLEASEASKQMRQEIADLRKQGKNEEADALELKRKEANFNAQKAITAALDQEKFKQAEQLLNEQKELREKAGQEAFEALDPKVKEKIKKLEAQAKEAIKDANSDSIKLLSKRKEDVAQIMAEAMIENQKSELVFKNTEVLWDKNSTPQKPDAKEKNVLNNKMREWIQSDPKTFECEEVADGQGDFVGKDGKSYKFNGNNFQKVMLRLSNDNQLDNNLVEDAANNADYIGAIVEKKEVADLEAGYSVRSTIKNRNFAKKCFETAGIDYEKDRTIG